MKELFDIVNEFNPLLRELAYGAIIFIPTLASVYLSGRMLGFLKRDITKNVLATIVNYTWTYFTVLLYIPYTSNLELIWIIIYKGAWGILLYVAVGFKLYDRVDNLLDKKIGDDDHKGKTRK